MKKSSLIGVAALVLALGIAGFAASKVDFGTAHVAQAIAVDRNGVPTVWISADGELHGHLQARKWWFGYKAVPEAALLTDAQVAAASKAEADYAKAKAEKAQKAAAKAKAKAEKEAAKAKPSK